MGATAWEASSPALYVAALQDLVRLSLTNWRQTLPRRCLVSQQQRGLKSALALPARRSPVRYTTIPFILTHRGRSVHGPTGAGAYKVGSPTVKTSSSALHLSQRLPSARRKRRSHAAVRASRSKPVVAMTLASCPVPYPWSRRWQHSCLLTH